MAPERNRVEWSVLLRSVVFGPAHPAPGPPSCAGYPMDHRGPPASRSSQLVLRVARAIPRGGSSAADGSGMESAEWRRAVLQSLPCVDMSQGELCKYPCFGKLLPGLVQLMDSSGLNLQLKRHLLKAVEDVRARRRHWLAAITLDRAVDEVLEDAAAAETPPSPADRQFSATLERCWVLGQTQRRLDPSQDVSDPPGVQLLGLDRQHLHPLLPPAKEVQAMRRRLPGEVEARLQLQCGALLSYVWPQAQGLSAGAILAQGEGLAKWLHAQGMRADHLHQQLRSDQSALARQSLACLTVLSSCSDILRSLVSTHRLSSRPELDRSLLQYLTTKGRALGTKLRLMRLELQHQTFDSATVGAHRRIRAELEECVRECECSRARLRTQLDLFGLLGPEFEQLVLEYGRLHSLLHNRRWALQQFSMSPGAGEPR